MSVCQSFGQSITKTRIRTRIITISLVFCYNLKNIVILFFPLRSEFKKEFLSELRKRRVTVYHTSIGVFPKVSLIERAILSIKKLFMRFFLMYKTMDFKNLLKLAELVYNGRRHSSIKNFSPFQVRSHKFSCRKICQISYSLTHN